MHASLETLKTVVGRIFRERRVNTRKLPGVASDLLTRAKRVLTQKQHDKDKLYNLHVPEASRTVGHIVRTFP